VQVVGGRKEFGSFTMDALPANALYKDLGGDEEKASTSAN